ncbi:MAG TPA: hypothetical protein VM536_11220, partial [Chloroflexia bacterium]|nr:hypothetical protein [Chloroflexia bacterium]
MTGAGAIVFAGRWVVWYGGGVTANGVRMRGERRYLAGAIAVVGLVALLLYAGTLQHGFIADDFIFLHQLRFPEPGTGAFSYFGRDWGMGAAFYRPLVRVLWAAEYQVFGQIPVGWHAVSLALYVANAALVAALAARVAGRASVGLLAGLLFAAHPAHPETVSWIANQSDLLAAFLGLSGVLTYLYAHSPR